MSGSGRPQFGVVVLTMGNRPDDLDRGLASRCWLSARSTSTSWSSATGGSRSACRTG